jgi:hypothetical protein
MILPLGPRLVALTILAAAAIGFWGANFASALSDIMLAVAACFVIARFLLGYEKEARAKKSADSTVQADLMESAATLYSLNSLQSPILLHVAFGGCAMKILAILAQVPAVQRLIGTG